MRCKLVNSSLVYSAHHFLSDWPCFETRHNLPRICRLFHARPGMCDVEYLHGTLCQVNAMGCYPAFLLRAFVVVSSSIYCFQVTCFTECPISTLYISQLIHFLPFSFPSLYLVFYIECTLLGKCFGRQ